jgi:hypothetical protein
MGKYVLTYSGGSGMPDTEEGMAELMAAWGGWFGSLGEDLVDGGNPFSVSRTIANGGASDNVSTITGYSIVTASDLDDATAKAQGCPVLGNGGAVAVHEAVDM